MNCLCYCISDCLAVLFLHVFDSALGEILVFTAEFYACFNWFCSLVYTVLHCYTFSFNTNLISSRFWFVLYFAIVFVGVSFFLS